MRYQVPRRCQVTNTNPRRPGTEIGLQSCEVARLCRVAGFATILSISLALVLPCSSPRRGPILSCVEKRGNLASCIVRHCADWDYWSARFAKRIRRRPGNVVGTRMRWLTSGPACSVQAPPLFRHPTVCSDSAPRAERAATRWGGAATGTRPPCPRSMAAFCGSVAS